MPELLPNLNNKKKAIGHGREIFAQVDDNDEEQINAYFKEQSHFDGQEGVNLLKRKFYEHKILNLLFPNNFPKWNFAGLNKTGWAGSVRERVHGDLKETDDSVELKKIEKLFNKFELSLYLDLARPNVFYSNHEKYVDTVSSFIKEEEDITKLDNIMNFLKTEKDLKERVLKFAYRILELR